jgi:YHS domain-containing protein
MTVNESKAVIKDPICGMTVDKGGALHAERNGEAFNLCGEHCRKFFLSSPAGTKSAYKSKACCELKRWRRVHAQTAGRNSHIKQLLLVRGDGPAPMISCGRSRYLMEGAVCLPMLG